MAAEKITNTTTTLKQLLTAATEPANQNAEAFHDLWERGKRELTREDQALLWSGLIAIRKNDFAGKPWRKTHPDADTSTPWTKAPAKEKHPIKAPSAPTKQAKKSTPAKQEKPAGKKAPTTKELLANMLLALNSIDQTMRSMNNQLANMDQRLTQLEKSAR